MLVLLLVVGRSGRKSLRRRRRRISRQESLEAHLEMNCAQG